MVVAVTTEMVFVVQGDWALLFSIKSIRLVLSVPSDHQYHWWHVSELDDAHLLLAN